jgi:aryl-alcohol dehydrogenase-like predicted oxidoreductase
MNYVKLGNTGLDVSPICLGTMSFGDKTSGWGNWVLDEQTSHQFIQQAIELGINFFDTANIYSYGSSEEYVGRALKNYAQRDEIVVATKVFNTMQPNSPNSGGLSRKAIMHQLDASLKRLGMDYVDLYIIHRFDYNTPIEETMSALNDAVKLGKVRYLGASAMYAWQFLKMQQVAYKHNLTPFVSMQNHYNLLYREEEREMLPMCADQKIALTPYSPLARGRLARNWAADTARFKGDSLGKTKYDSTEQTDKVIVDRVAELANRYSVPQTHIALAWSLSRPQVASVIVGATKPQHISEAVASLNFKLTDDDCAYLEKPYIPHRVMDAL